MAPSAPGPQAPVSTYRVQLRPAGDDHPGFTFDDAAAVVPYLSRLGVTHLYCSPWLQAAAGSTHGYDVVDPTRVSDDLGGPDAHARLVAACREAGLGIVLDVVPNHMSVAEPENANRWWWDVLKHGRGSPYAEWFDLHWEGSETPGRLLVPVLGDHLGAVVARGEVSYDDSRDAIDEPVIRYYDHVLPVAPGTEKLAGPAAADLLALLDAQHYVLARWQRAADELDYRRFFDVTTLAGLRVEVPEAFQASHSLVVEQVRSGVVDGLRIDHPDGLADPEGYLRMLAEATDDRWVVVEKILEAGAGERLPQSWPCAGTTGYDVLNRVLGVFVDPAGEAPLTELYDELTGAETDFATVVLAAKQQVVEDVLAAELVRLEDLAVEIARADPMTCDVTRREIREALTAVLVSFEVYRAYVGIETGPSREAREQLADAAARATHLRPELAATISLVVGLARGDGLAHTTGRDRQVRADFLQRFQQTCGPVMAKGVEDTAFYRYARLLALNEVGGDPGRFGTSPALLHEAAVEAAAVWPASMTTLSTHDTKRSEDVRARLALLSEIPERWAERVSGWIAGGGSDRDDLLPDRVAEYFLHQTLFGAWPISEDRAWGYLQKAAREAKSHTTWTAPDEEYETALRTLLAERLADADHVADLEAFVAELSPAWWVTALSQKLVQLTLPGVADTYQGTELWDLSLVDPDNRRPVDYAGRLALLDQLDAGGTPPPPDATGAAKLWLTSRTLRLRRDRPGTFVGGAHAALSVAGPAADHLLAYVRGGSRSTSSCWRPVWSSGSRSPAVGGTRRSACRRGPGTTCWAVPAVRAGSARSPSCSGPSRPRCWSAPDQSPFRAVTVLP